MTVTVVLAETVTGDVVVVLTVVTLVLGGTVVVHCAQYPY